MHGSVDFRFISDPRLGHDDNCEPVAVSSLVFGEMNREMSNDIRSEVAGNEARYA